MKVLRSRPVSARRRRGVLLLALLLLLAPFAAGAAPALAATATLTGFSVNPNSVVSGSSTTATVTLSAAAPAGGFVVELNSRLPLVAQIPSTVTVPAGATSASVTVTTTASSDNFAVLLEAGDGTVVLGIGLDVTPNPSIPVPPFGPVLTLTPTTVAGGTTATGTLNLITPQGVDAPAPAGGATITLSSNNPAATVPASVTIPAGSKAATFLIHTSAVSAQTTAAISASFLGETASPPLTILPAAQVKSATVQVTATGRKGVTVLSTPAGISAAVGAGPVQATFPLGTTITLSPTDGRDAVWSGACSSGGRKTKSCSFTLSGPAAVSASVQ